jgi:hypothetical protein
MTDLQLFRVTVTQEWSAEGTAMVLAPDAATAEKWADIEVELDLHDADDGISWTSARPEQISLETLDKIKADDLWLIMPTPGRPDLPDTVELDQFRAVFTPERLEALRLAAIERDNGQIALSLEVAA